MIPTHTNEIDSDALPARLGPLARARHRGRDAMSWEVLPVHPLPDYRIDVEIESGRTGIFGLTSCLQLKQHQRI
jgi:hypothetical protein